MPLKTVLFLFFLSINTHSFAQNKHNIRESTHSYRDSLKTAFTNETDMLQLISIVKSSIYFMESNKNRLNYEESFYILNYFLSEVNQKRKSDNILPYIQNGLGFIYAPTTQGKMIASDYLLNSFSYIQSTNDSEWLGRNYLHIGSVFYDIGDYENARKYFRNAEKIIHKIPLEDVNIISTYNTYSLIFQRLEKYDSALIYYQKGLIYAEAKKDTVWIGLLKGNIGSMLIKQKKYNEALALLYFDVMISIKNEMFANAVISLSEIIKIHLEQKNKLAAEQKLNQSLSIIKRVPFIPTELTAYLRHYEATSLYYEYIKDYAKALHYQKLYDQTEDEQKKYIKDIEIQRIIFRYDYELQQRNMNKLIKENENQRIYIDTISVGLLVVILLIVILAQRFYQKNILMSKLKLQHEQITQINEKLTINVEKITAQSAIIESQNKELQMSNLSKDKIFTLISHDFRTPLFSLKGLIEILKNDMFSINELKEMLPTVEENLDRTLNLSEELLYWATSQMKGLKTKPEALNPKIIVQDILFVLKEYADKKQIKLTENISETTGNVWADDNMVKTVLRNLITNALKFCNAADTITISAQELGNGFVVFTVKDTGTGIKLENLSKIFSDTPFTTQGTSGEKGTGFGLILCKDFILQNGGQIWVNSVWGEGTVFSFTLPLAD